MSPEVKPPLLNIDKILKFLSGFAQKKNNVNFRKDLREIKKVICVF